MSIAIPRSRTGSWAMNVLGVLAAAGMYLSLRMLDLPFEERTAVAFSIAMVLGVGGLLGMVFGHLMARNSDVDTKLYGIIACSSLIVWLLPILGVCVAAMTYEFYRWSRTRAGLYCALSACGIVLSCISAGYGTIAAMRSINGQSAEMVGVGDSAHRLGQPQIADYRPGATSVPVHSPERCPYAAIENWPMTDFKKYCR